MNNTKSYTTMPRVGALAPVVVKNSEVFTSVVDMASHLSVCAVLEIGDVASEGIVFRCVACDSNGANPTATLTGKTMTVVASASANDSTSNVIQLTAGELAAIQSTKRYVKFGVVTDNTVGGPMSISVFSTAPRYGSGTGADAATVVTVV